MSSWSPLPFDGYRALYPATPGLALPADDRTSAFERAWALSDAELDEAVRTALSGVRVAFVRGYLGNWMPGNLVGATRSLRALGVDARILRNRAGASVGDNASRLRDQLAGDGRILLCGHSRGGLECLAAADGDPALAARVVGVLMSQTPRGPSAVLESLLDRAHEGSLSRRRWVEEWSQRVGLVLVGAAEGGRSLTGERLTSIVTALDGVERPFPVWQTASWSSTPTTWLDSFHERLGEIRPGCAHDGQFFVEDLIWPGLPHVLLAHVDHAQPAMGGFGFDAARYWKALVTAWSGGGAA